jgi:hypothetical protein
MIPSLEASPFRAHENTYTANNLYEIPPSNSPQKKERKNIAQ